MTINEYLNEKTKCAECHSIVYSYLNLEEVRRGFLNKCHSLIVLCCLVLISISCAMTSVVAREVMCIC